DRGPVLARRRGEQRGQRRARRLPRTRHVGRDQRPRRGRGGRRRPGPGETPATGRHVRGGGGVTRSLIMDTAARLIFHPAVVLSLYLLFAGHNQPGGGFVGGLVAAAAVGMYYVAGGIDDVRSLSRLRP